MREKQTIIMNFSILPGKEMKDEKTNTMNNALVDPLTILGGYD